ncbi:VPLPA-CTERM sorting domain-containing protein [Methylomonas sp. LW13]|uniref:VPLPA-CTERM sorting domain-containing protein n=1 Tax=Methylomonas defluvii TaxID=3045149 RepID=A0ABU4UHJ5_9GAMM|nr:MULTISPECIES: VPLPA-CTERM sorting domain-containing protein [unclassified Methylomonas]MDX8128204.1 VPLPA-CTERM sorting domain-containing protein [Methylomonas sp. OY6]PKD38890.1 VPLPA-CTERM sorting domain-containing protein [Methylomonas sp. Kb3]QBC29140.1 VPLPA-CTERM sorting domain-containing protein [Methylomonas sp. LW13]
MIKQLILLASLLCILPSSQAATSLQLEPTNGLIEGDAGDTVGWGFLLTNTQNYLVVTGAEFQSSTSPGIFTDFISAPENFFVVGPGFGASTVWGQTFDAASQTGVGSFKIADNAAQGTVFGQIVLTYDLFTRSPFNPLFDPDTDTLSNGNVLTANASINITTVPLPAAAWLFGAALAGLGFIGQRRI